VSALSYEQRLDAIRKFCKAVNRGVQSIATDLPPMPQQQQNRKRRYDHQQQLPEFRTPTRPPIAYYLHHAEIVQTHDLEDKFGEIQPVFYKPKLLQLPLLKFDFPDGMSNQEELRLPCLAVRFVQRYKGKRILFLIPNQLFFSRVHALLVQFKQSAVHLRLFQWQIRSSHPKRSERILL
jgi:hypothetical protein